MREHHQHIIDKLVEKYKDDPLFPAMIIGGSIAKGTEKETSDIDIMLVASDEEFARRRESKEYHFFDWEISDYPGVYVDAKIISLQFLIDAARKGSEPARAGFIGAYPAYSRVSGIEEIIKQIPVYPEHERARKLDAFYSQLYPLRHFAIEAIEKDNPFLLSRMSSDLILFCGRIILAQNRILFPSLKGLLGEIEKAQTKPENVMESIHKLINNPCPDTIDGLFNKIWNYDSWDIKPSESTGVFLENNDWSWLKDKTPLGEY